MARRRDQLPQPEEQSAAGVQHQPRLHPPQADREWDREGAGQAHDYNNFNVVKEYSEGEAVKVHAAKDKTEEETYVLVINPFFEDEGETGVEVDTSEVEDSKEIDAKETNVQEVIEEKVFE